MACRYAVMLLVVSLMSTCILSWSVPKNLGQSEGQNAHLHLATKTPYRYVKNTDESPIQFKGCHSKRIWMIVRHGTRNPGLKMIRQMREQLPELRKMILRSAETNQTNLCTEEITALLNWKPHVEEADMKRLTHEGEDEMIELAERFQNRLRDLFPSHYKNSTYKFRYTATQRTGESARYFALGLFGRKESRHVWFPKALHRDPILRFYKLCSRWRSEVDKNPESLVERKKFENGPEMQTTLENISSRLGLNHTLSVGDVHLMYMTCAFETAWEWRTKSPWCAVFSEDDLKILEYSEDLEYYWVDGYGYEITHKQACPAIRDMAQYINQSFKGETLPKAVVYFTHSGTVLKVLSHLGLYKDNVTLLHTNYSTTGNARKWRVGQIDGFASNLAFILFQCNDGHKVLTLHQERPVVLPGCPGSLCPLDILLQSYKESIQHCDFDKLCSEYKSEL